MPTLGVGCILKNEGKCVYKFLSNVSQMLPDVICITDTGSTDDTACEIMRWACTNNWLVMQTAPTTLPEQKTIIYTTFLGASEQDETGWQLWDFGRARQHYVDILDPIVDYIYWGDIDDSLANPQDIRLLLPDEPADPPQIWAMPITSGVVTWQHHRLWQTKAGCRYEVGATVDGKIMLGNACCHEYPQFLGFQQLPAEHHHIQHAHVDAPAKEASEPRNLRILKRKYEQADAAPRNVFYLATAYRDVGQQIPAVSFYTEYLNISDNKFHAERMTAFIYRTRCYREVGLTHDALRSAFEGLAVDCGEHSELWVEAAYAFNALGKGNLGRLCATAAIQHAPMFSLFPEPACYDSEPARIIKGTK